MASLGSFRIQPIGTALSGLIPVQIRDYKPSISFSLCAFMLVSSLLLGGGTRGGFLSDAILELIAILVLFISLSSLIDLPIWRTKPRPDVYRVLMFCSAMALLPLIQLVPLPPWIWTHLPGRGQMAEVFDVLGDPTPWMPISVSPHATWLSFLSLLPPMAIFVAAIQLSYRERRGSSLVIIAVGIVGAFVGLTQVAQGPASLLRFFSITNDTEAVGFFANRNHFAALLYAVLLFTAVWAIDAGFKIGSWSDLKSFQAATAVALTVFIMFFIVVIAAAAMARSRAGLALTIVALLAIFAMIFTDRRNATRANAGNSRVKVARFLLAALVVALILALQFAVYRILQRFGTDPLEDARLVFAHNTIAAAKAFLPFGSGSGTFVPVYQMFEKPSDVLANIYANRAHDDMLELWLETGVLGPLLLCLFVVWLGITSIKLWRRPPVEMSAFDYTLARAATVVIALLLAHSFVDYPMRTEAIMAVLAICCALLIEPVTDGEDGAKLAAALERYLVRQREAPKAQSAALTRSSTTATPRQAETIPLNRDGRRWGAEIDWPEEWRDTETRTPSKTDTEMDTEG